ncbi:GGDEF domain-containing protein [Marinimicrobium sp. C2-29]|uniref:GGDEF domain-containing protein n=1 Tax=Marinimicrobium sp. C2-29 TaxID=3139825 RepID=UPI003138995B
MFSNKDNSEQDLPAPATNEGRRGRFGLEKGLALLLLLTLAAILGERWILGTSMTLTANDGFLSHYSDGAEGGGSVSEVTDPDAIGGRCRLADQAEYAFCGFELILGPRRQNGLDLTNFDRIKLFLDYEGPTKTIRLYLRNYDPAYSKPEANDSTKYNQIEFEADMVKQGEPLEFSMADFFVANWWFQRYRIAPELTHPQFDNIVVIEVQTGSTPVPGEHLIKLKKIELTGQVLSTEHWYQGILGAWLIVALAFLAGRTVTLKRELSRRGERERELVEINSLLDRRGRELEEKVKTDPLTGAFNRQGIEEAIELGLAERRQGKPMSLIMLDVDHFKQVNDSHGHPTGDRILSGLSHLVQENIRGSDLFARWGGEEFVLVCRDTGLKDAAGLAEKLRALLEGQSFGEPVTITASFGVATLGARENLEHLFVRVDDALYAAKERGRNRVEVAF